MTTPSDLRSVFLRKVCIRLLNQAPTHPSPPYIRGVGQWSPVCKGILQ